MLNKVQAAPDATAAGGKELQKMVSKPKVIVVTAVFAVILLFPFIYNAVGTGMFSEVKRPQVVIEKSGQCIKYTGYMRRHHGDMLERNMELVQKEGMTNVVGLNDCRKCHSNREEFCDRCHDYVGVYAVNDSTGCFTCHDYPKTKKEAESAQKKEAESAQK